MKFRYTWRPYQKRILNELEPYLEDKRLHIIAAPGSGKTVLGLEVIRRLNKPTLVLVPTLAIQDQWVERLMDLFLPPSQNIPNWISTEIKNPKLLTVATYQGLHSAFTGLHEDTEVEEEEDEKQECKDGENNQSPLIFNLIENLKKIAVGTVVVDEAHHLRSNWWKSLTKTIEEIHDPTLVALTATPPFDVPESEWERYMNLCGPLDAQIPVPELVQEKNLCPHQDYIMFSTPTKAENSQIFQLRKSIYEFTKSLYQNQDFIDHLANHPWIINPDEHMSDLLEAPAFFSSILVFLSHLGYNIPKSTMKIITASPKVIPKLDYEWLEILLEGLIFPTNRKIPKLPQFLDDLKQDLSQMGVLERRTINFLEPEVVEKILNRSLSKLASIKKIADLEFNSLAHNLRMVILTDYIRKNFIPSDRNELPDLTKIGVVPIFEFLRRDSPKYKLGVLTGSLIIIPTEIVNLLDIAAEVCNIDSTSIKVSPLGFTDEYVEIDVLGAENPNKVQLITELFTRGGIEVLVGTKALLGEGWDAPSINTLILASFVGSYMLSNQMRGRAIRTERKNPEKTANIWHLICIESKRRLSFIKDKSIPSKDFDILKRRFQAFVGPSFKENQIQSGIARLDIGIPPFTETEIESINKIMCRKAINRGEMRKDWIEALQRGDEGVKLVENIKIKKESLPQGFVFYNTISAILWESLLFFLLIIDIFIRSLAQAFASAFYSIEFAFIFLAIAFVIPSLILLPGFLKASWLFIKHGTIKSSMKQIGIVLLKSLIFTGDIRTEYKKMKIKAEKGEMGTVFCHLEGATPRETVIYLDALEEILNPIENPRYLLIRKSILLNRLGRLDYHAVPSRLGEKKKFAEYFAYQWKKHIGKMELIYTRNTIGRKILLKARNHSLSSHFVPKAERISRWS